MEFTRTGTDTIRLLEETPEGIRLRYSLPPWFPWECPSFLRRSILHNAWKGIHRIGGIDIQPATFLFLYAEEGEDLADILISEDALVMAFDFFLPMDEPIRNRRNFLRTTMSKILRWGRCGRKRRWYDPKPVKPVADLSVEAFLRWTCDLRVEAPLEVGKE